MNIFDRKSQEGKNFKSRKLNSDFPIARQSVSTIPPMYFILFISE